MLGNSFSLDNGLFVSIDWLSFTVVSTTDIVDALDLFGYVIDDFAKLPKGARGYKTMYKVNGGSIYALCDGNVNMGVHIDVSGSSVADFLQRFSESLKIATPFGEGYDIDFDTTFMMALLEQIQRHGHLTRFDIAIDDVGCKYFSTDDIVRMYDSARIISKFRNMRNVIESESFGRKTGHTVYFGSRTSDIFLRVYDKQLEQNKKLADENKRVTNPWVRWELELKNERAVSVANMLVSGIKLGTVAVGVLGHYMRMIDLDDVNRSRCSTYSLWVEFTSNVAALKITVPKMLKTLDEKRSWVERQVAPTLAAIILADGGSLEFLENNLVSGLDRMNHSLYEMAMAELHK